MDKIIIGSFDNVDEADRAYRDLLQTDFRSADVDLIVSDAERVTADKLWSSERSALGSAVRGSGSAAVKAAVAGGILGGAAALAATLMGLAVYGIQPILDAGPIVATLAGAAAGAVVGGLIGALVDAGMREKTAETPVAMRRGGSLVTVRTTELRQDDAAAILRKNGAVEIARREEEARPATWSEPTVDRDRARYDAAQAERATAEVGGALSDSAWAPPR